MPNFIHSPQLASSTLPTLPHMVPQPLAPGNRRKVKGGTLEREGVLGGVVEQGLKCFHCLRIVLPTRPATLARIVAHQFDVCATRQRQDGGAMSAVGLVPDETAAGAGIRQNPAPQAAVRVATVLLVVGAPPRLSSCTPKTKPNAYQNPVHCSFCTHNGKLRCGPLDTRFGWPPRKFRMSSSATTYSERPSANHPSC